MALAGGFDALLLVETIVLHADALLPRKWRRLIAVIVYGLCVNRFGGWRKWLAYTAIDSLGGVFVVMTKRARAAWKVV